MNLKVLIILFLAFIIAAAAIFYYLTSNPSFDNNNVKEPVKPYSPYLITDSATGFKTFSNFVTRSGDKLMDGDKEFRFISFNIPNLHMLEDPDWHMPDPWEQEDALKSIVQMGGLVTRTYVISVGKSSNSIPRHVTAPGEFSEELFRALDKTLELANKNGVRVIIPFVDQWDWWGGIKTYAGFRGKGKNAFWTDREIIDDFKKTINYVLNRTNYYTGIKYKDDKAILAWETGNELNASEAWTREITAYIKNLDSNHLVLDGRYGVNKDALDNPDIDIVSDHYYPGDGKNFSSRCSRDKNKAGSEKVFIIGEFGFNSLDNMRDMLDAATRNGTSGALIWSLRYHNRDGGFYWHDEGNSGFSAYHWPGFSSGNAWNEEATLKLMHEYAFKIRSLAPPEVTVPEPPTLLSISSLNGINWRGSTGASSYDVERSESKNGPWVVIGKDISDAKKSGLPLFTDTSTIKGKTCYYRVKAKNSAGYSQPSNIVEFKQGK